MTNRGTPDRVHLTRVETITDSPAGIPLFLTVCRCGWVDKPRKSYQSADAQAGKHIREALEARKEVDDNE